MQQLVVGTPCQNKNPRLFARFAHLGRRDSFFRKDPDGPPIVRIRPGRPLAPRLTHAQSQKPLWCRIALRPFLRKIDARGFDFIRGGYNGVPSRPSAVYNRWPNSFARLAGLFTVGHSLAWGKRMQSPVAVDSEIHALQLTKLLELLQRDVTATEFRSDWQILKCSCPVHSFASLS